MYRPRMLLKCQRVEGREPVVVSGGEFVVVEARSMLQPIPEGGAAAVYRTHSAVPRPARRACPKSSAGVEVTEPFFHGRIDTTGAFPRQSAFDISRSRSAQAEQLVISAVGPGNGILQRQDSLGRRVFCRFHN